MNLTLDDTSRINKVEYVPTQIITENFVITYADGKQWLGQREIYYQQKLNTQEWYAAWKKEKLLWEITNETKT